MGQFVTTEVISSQIDDVTVESTQTESACTQPESFDTASGRLPADWE